MLPKTPLEKRAVRSCFELSSSTLFFMTVQLGWALRDLPKDHFTRDLIARERAKIATLAQVFDVLMDANVRP